MQLAPLKKFGETFRECGGGILMGAEVWGQGVSRDGDFRLGDDDPKFEVGREVLISLNIY